MMTLTCGRIRNLQLGFGLGDHFLSGQDESMKAVFVGPSGVGEVKVADKNEARAMRWLNVNPRQVFQGLQADEIPIDGIDRLNITVSGFSFSLLETGWTFEGMCMAPSSRFEVPGRPKPRHM